MEKNILHIEVKKSNFYWEWNINTIKFTDNVKPNIERAFTLLAKELWEEIEFNYVTK